MKDCKKSCLVIIAMLSAGVVSAAIVETSNNSITDDFITARVNNDLINSGQDTLDSVVGDSAYVGLGWNGLTGLNDGYSALGFVDPTGKTFFDVETRTVTFSLDTSVNSFGYDITDINTYAAYGAGSSDYANQKYEILVSTVLGGAGFTPLYTVDYSPFTSGTAGATIVSLSGIVATGVDAIRFDFANEGNGTVYQEIDVIGTSTIPEPATLGMLIAMTGGMLFIRSRFVL